MIFFSTRDAMRKHGPCCLPVSVRLSRSYLDAVDGWRYRQTFFLTR